MPRTDCDSHRSSIRLLLLIVVLAGSAAQRLRRQLPSTHSADRVGCARGSNNLWVHNVCLRNSGRVISFLALPAKLLIVTSIDQIAAAKIRPVTDAHLGGITVAEGGAAPALPARRGVPLAAILLANLSAKLKSHVFRNGIHGIR